MYCRTLSRDLAPLKCRFILPSSPQQLDFQRTITLTITTVDYKFQFYYRDGFSLFTIGSCPWIEMSPLPASFCLLHFFRQGCVLFTNRAWEDPTARPFVPNANYRTCVTASHQIRKRKGTFGGWWWGGFVSLTG